jgi:hypothetical protein
MSNADKPAFSGSYTGNNGMPVWSDGMTKLEYFAGLAMQGMAHKYMSAGLTSYEIGQASVMMAQALLAELEKGGESDGQ